MSVLDAGADWIFGAAADCSPKGRCFRLNYFFWVISFWHMIAETCAHLGAFKLKIV